MKNVRIYIKVSNRTIKAIERIGMYVIAYRKGDGTDATLTRAYRSHGTWIQTEAMLLVDALRKFREPCHIDIYTDCAQTSVMLEMWLPKWRENGWKKADGKNVADIYSDLDTAAALHEINITQERHEYASWVETEAKGDMTCCTKDLESLTARKKSTVLPTD